MSGATAPRPVIGVERPLIGLSDGELLRATQQMVTEVRAAAEAAAEGLRLAGEDALAMVHAGHMLGEVAYELRARTRAGDVLGAARPPAPEPDPDIPPPPPARRRFLRRDNPAQGHLFPVPD